MTRFRRLTLPCREGDGELAVPGDDRCRRHILLALGWSVRVEDGREFWSKGRHRDTTRREAWRRQRSAAW